MPKGDTTIQPEDVLFVMGTKEGLIKMRKLLRASAKPKETKYV
jgi:uncharacterized protein with PhoU and TrkA domain